MGKIMETTIGFRVLGMEKNGNYYNIGLRHGKDTGNYFNGLLYRDYQKDPLLHFSLTKGQGRPNRSFAQVNLSLNLRQVQRLEVPRQQA